MRTIKNVLILIISLGVFFLTGCNHNATTATVKGEGITADKKVTVNISTKGDYSIFPKTQNYGNRSARTIVSDAYEGSEVKFYLFGTNKTKNTELTPKEITVTSTDTRTGTINLEIGSYVWNLFIAACDSGDEPAAMTSDAILAKAVLLGEVTADLRGDKDTIDFILTPDGLTKTGTVGMKIYTDGWTVPDGWTVKAGIYDPDTGTELKTFDATLADQVTEQSFTGTMPDAAPGSANYTAGGANIKPGSNYQFIVEFTAASGKKYYYSDKIIILPGKGNTSTVAIPNTIDLPPTAPTNFKVGYIDPANATSEFYTAEFEWVRSSTKTEKYYEFELAKLGVPDSDSNVYALPTSDTTWDAMKAWSSLTTTETYAQDFYKHPFVWVAGSLLKGNQSASLKLNLGNRYFARIRAVNDAGPSEWVYVTFGNTTNGTAFTSTTINRYKIKYSLKDAYGNPCTITPAETPVVEYHCENSTGVAIMCPDGSGAITLKDATDAVWTNWQGYNEPGVAPAAYTGFENLELIPVFAAAGTITIYNDADYVMNSSNIAIVGTKADSTTQALSITNDLVEVDIGTIKSVTFTLTYPTGIVYDSCYLTLAKTTSVDSYIRNININKTTLSFEMDVSDLYSSKYWATFHYSINGRNYTNQIIVSIVE